MCDHHLYYIDEVSMKLRNIFQEINKEKYVS